MKRNENSTEMSHGHLLQSNITLNKGSIEITTYIYWSACRLELNFFPLDFAVPLRTQSHLTEVRLLPTLCGTQTLETGKMGLRPLLQHRLAECP